MLLTGFPLMILGVVVDSRARGLISPVNLFILGMSFLAHKEWRFIVYAIPFYNVAAARGAWWYAFRLSSIEIC